MGSVQKHLNTQCKFVYTDVDKLDTYAAVSIVYLIQIEIHLSLHGGKTEDI